MTTELKVHTLEDLLEASAATAEFKDAVRNLKAGQPQDRIEFPKSNPPVKVLRLTMKLLEECAGHPIESVRVEGVSGCSNYEGAATIQPGDLRFEFEWNCRWRAEQEGWMDAFGDPDQIRAAQTFGYQCFRRLDRR